MLVKSDTKRGREVKKMIASWLRLLVEISVPTEARGQHQSFCEPRLKYSRVNRSMSCTTHTTGMRLTITTLLMSRASIILEGDRMRRPRRPQGSVRDSPLSRRLTDHLRTPPHSFLHSSPHSSHSFTIQASPELGKLPNKKILSLRLPSTCSAENDPTFSRLPR